MKAMQNKSLLEFGRRLWPLVALTAVATLGSVYAQTMGPAQAQNYVIDRSPANYAHNDDLVIVPEATEHWSENLLVDDDAGVLNSMRVQINDWQRTEEYVQQWDLDSTGLYTVASQEQKKSYIMRNLLRYLDKRLAGEVKSADKGSTMHTVGQVHRTLRPTSEAAISQNIKLKFKARALQGKAFVTVENPWVDAQSSVSVDGRVDVRVAKQFKDLGVQSEVRYRLQDDMWVAQVDKKLTEQISARVSSEQESKEMAFGSESNRTFQLMYHRPF